MSTYSMAAPLAIQISYNHQCMIFSDFNNQKIVILELSSKQLKRVLPKQSGSVCLERNYNNKNQDALFIVSSLCIVKFDLHQLLTNNFNEQMALWTSEKLKNPSSMVVHESRQLFVTDTTDVKVFNTRNGQLLQVIQMPVNVKRVTGIDFFDHDTMIVGEGNPYNRLIVFKNVQNDNAENSERKFVWQFEKQLVESTASKNSSWSYSMYLTVDKASLNIIACDCYDHSIKIYTQHGDLLKSIGTSGSNLQQFRYPQGLCLDELTGELYVSDTDNSRIQIFK
ncbi:hypothetical protein C9374_005901 [Naegleria lovaniensis]|uniref:Uncharacterized protein n=1 Tax=Naegleria lovaniensis TaxID=51637 RepID=A0AA88GJG5_NAELO|nr:uncharacterized protein C9374_005901 [Naegleria lovaniensis]KAG2382109.1 hypothetical protein C9374_005901 [Naegleria lovaniensis]